MTARLFSRIGDTRGLTLELEAGGETIVGRDPASDLAIEQPLMSGRHARIFYDADAGRFVIEDLDSLNGTELDGDRVTGKEYLGHLNVITFAGSYEFFFVDAERGARRHLGLPAEAVRSPAKERPAVEEAPEKATPAAETAGKLGGGDSEEVTAVDVEPFSMPDFLARRADALRDSAEADSERPSTPSELTSIEREPIALPGFLAQRADDASAGAPEEPAKDVPTEDTPVADTADSGEGKREKTMHEKLPVALPGALARRVEEVAGGEHPDVQKHETVDLAQIEKLIAEEEAAERDERAARLQLIVTASGGRVRRYPLATGENLVGRGANAKVVLKYPDLSRRHALITVAGEEITVRDLGSRNRTFVDDQALEPEVDVAVEPGARLRFGSVEARLRKVGD